MTLHLFLRPLDVWLFRDGKPFNAGSDHRARSIFPPLPTVIQGAIRTHYIERHGGIPAYLAGDLSAVEEVVGQPGTKPPESFNVYGPFVARWENDQLTRYFRLPDHAYQHDDTYHLLHPQSEPDILTDLNAPVDLLWPEPDTSPTKRDDQKEDQWLSEKALKHLLTQKQLPIRKNGENYDQLSESKLFTREMRLGIERNDYTLGSEEGAIYQAEFIRLCEQAGLYIAVEGVPDWPERGVLMLGGEGHTAAYQQIDGPAIEAQRRPASEKFTVTFLTPTFFEEGWHSIDWAKFWEGTAMLKAVAIDRPLVLGGFDVAKKTQKPSRRYVPAGSTFYFQGDVTINSNSICDDPADDRIGFGQFMLGEWE